MRRVALLAAVLILGCSSTTGPSGYATHSSGQGLATVERCESIFVMTLPDGTVTEDKRGCTSHQSEHAEDSEPAWQVAIEGLALLGSIIALSLR